MQFPNPADQWANVPQKYIVGTGGDTTDPHDNDPELMSVLSDYMGKLASYGTADSLALHFADIGLKALPGEARSCAIAKHANETLDLPEDCYVSVGSSSMYIEQARTIQVPFGETVRTATTYDRLAGVDHDDVARDFVHGFDRKQYPNLIDEEEEDRRRVEAMCKAEKHKAALNARMQDLLKAAQIPAAPLTWYGDGDKVTS